MCHLWWIWFVKLEESPSTEIREVIFSYISYFIDNGTDITIVHTIARC